MSNTDNAAPVPSFAETAMPTNQNITVVQAVALAAMIAAMFGLKVPAQTQAEIATAIVSVSAVVTWALHTFVNHPRNIAAAQKISDANLNRVMGSTANPAAP